MVEGLNKPLRHCTSSELMRHSEDAAVRASLAGRKYSVGLLEEAYQLAKSIGPKKAALTAGVSLTALNHYRIIRRREEGIISPPRYSTKIPHDKKLEVLKYYLQLRRIKWAKSMRKCWIKAGEMAGANGRTVEFQYNRGIWNPNYDTSKAHQQAVR